MAGCQVNEDVLCKRWSLAVAVAEILALFKTHVLGSAVKTIFFCSRV